MSTAENPVIAEGKTKIIRAIPGTDEVLVISKDDITAGDGAKRDILENKGVLSTTTTSNCFRLLNLAGVPTHFIGKEDEVTFRARNVEMIPLELVARRIAWGSYLERNPGIEKGTVFDPLVLEFFDKDDARHDPMVIYDFVGSRAFLYGAHKPIGEGFLEELPLENAWEWSTTVRELTRMTTKVFEVLEKAWAAQKVTLVDLKIECGLDRATGELLVADVVDNDSWRIWPGGDPSLMLDKQVYRNLSHTTPEALKSIQGNYQLVAEATSNF